MSDGISEAYGGTYFRDRSKPKPTERELLESRKRIIEIEIDDYKWELQNINDRLKALDE
jgi:c-di-AMP phosphodiesterase-like protein